MSTDGSSWSPIESAVECCAIHARVRLKEQSSSSSRSDSSGIEKWWVCSAAPVELVVATALGEQRLQKTQTRLGLFVDGVLLLLGLSVLLLQPPAGGALELVLIVTQFPAQPVLQLLSL